MIVTFYSFKGGVGRSLAMSNVAEILADLGYRVIVCDWDLEAPGLERYVAATKEESDALAEKPGLLDLLVAYKKVLSGTPDHEVPPAAQAKAGELLLRRPSSYAIRVSAGDANRRSLGSVSLLSAGRRKGPDGDEFQSYAEAVRTFDWDDFYREWAGGAYMDFLRADLSAGRPADHPSGPIEPAGDIVLIDSRTGVTEHGGVATHHLADIVVLLSAANDLNMDGTTWMSDALSKPELEEIRGGRALTVLPVASRIEQTSERDLVGGFRRRFCEQFGHYLPHLLGDPKEFFLDTEIPYLPFYSFTERVAAREPPELRDEFLFRKYEALAHAVIECGTSRGLLAGSVPPQVRLRSLVRAVEAPRGVFAIQHAPDSETHAMMLSAALARLGVTLASGEASLAPGAARTSADPTGNIFVIGPSTSPGWVRAQVDEALRMRAANADFRIVPVLVGDVPLTTVLHLHRLRPVTLSPSAIDNDAQAVLIALAARTGVAPEAPGTCPFPGAGPYEERDARFFFGRDDALREVANRCGDTSWRALEIAGPGGAGKTSFLQAGLLPAIRRRALMASKGIGPIVVARLGTDPVAAVTSALAAAFTDSGAGSIPAPAPLTEIDAALTGSPSALADIAGKLAPGGQNVLLAVDDVDMRRPEVADLMRRLLDAAVMPQSKLLLIWTSDAGARGAQNVVRYDLPPLTAQQWTLVATTGARMTGRSWDDSALAAFARDVESHGDPAYAPLIGLVLHRVSQEGGSVLTVADYLRVGGPISALLREADARIDALTEHERHAAKALLVALTVPTDTGIAARSIPRASALAAAGGGPQAEQVLARLAAAPAIVRDGTTVELADPSLVDKWDRLHRWTSDERVYGFLRSRKLWTTVAIAAAVILVILTNGVQWFSEMSRDTSLDADLLAGEARNVQEDDPIRGLAFAVAAGADSQSDTVRGALVNALHQPYPALLLSQEDPVTDAAVNADATTIISGTSRGIVRLWGPVSLPGAAGGTQPRAEFKPADSADGGERVMSVQLSPDGRTAAATFFSGSALLLNVGNGSQTMLRGHNGPVVSAAFSSDSRLLVTASLDGTALIWSAQDGRIIAELKGHEAAVKTASFDPDGKHVLTTSLDGTARVWDLAGHVENIIEPDAARDPITAGDIRSGIIALGGNALTVVNRATGKVTPIRTGEVRGLAVSPDGKWLAGIVAQPAENDVEPAARVYAWRSAVPDETQALTFIKKAESEEEPVPTHVAIDPRRMRVAAATLSGWVTLWDMNQPALSVRDFRAHKGPVTHLGFSADGLHLLTSGEDNTIAVWDLTEPLTPPEGSTVTALVDRGRSILSRLLTEQQLAAILPQRR